MWKEMSDIACMREGGAGEGVVVFFKLQEAAAEERARDVTGAGGGGGGEGGDRGEGNRREHCSVSVLLQGSRTGPSARACMHDVTRVLQVAPLRWWQWWGMARDAVVVAGL